MPTTSQSRLELGLCLAIDSNGRTILIANAHRDNGKRLVAHAEEKLTAFLELEPAIGAAAADIHTQRKT